MVCHYAELMKKDLFKTLMTISFYYTSKDGASTEVTDSTAYAFVFQNIALTSAQIPVFINSSPYALFRP